jgi:hypothetical protein
MFFRVHVRVRRQRVDIAPQPEAPVTYQSLLVRKMLFTQVQARAKSWVNTRLGQPAHPYWYATFPYLGEAACGTCDPRLVFDGPGHRPAT